MTSHHHSWNLILRSVESTLAQSEEETDIEGLISESYLVKSGNSALGETWEENLQMGTCSSPASLFSVD